MSRSARSGGPLGLSPAGKFTIYFVLIVVSLSTLLPLFWMISTSLKPPSEINLPVPTIFPVDPTFANYIEAWGRADFARYARNSTIYAAGTTIFMLLFCAMAGYALSRLRFKGRNLVTLLVIGLLLVPWETHLIPNFLVIRYFPLAGGNDFLGQGGSGLIDSFSGLMLPNIVTPFGVFLMRQFFISLPRELEEAGRIDGASHLRIFAQIAMPLSVPSLATLGILTFVGTWNAFTWPLVVTHSETVRTLQLGLQVFKEASPVQPWGVLMAASCMSILPLVLLFLFGQRYFMASLAHTGLKG